MALVIKASQERRIPIQLYSFIKKNVFLLSEKEFIYAKFILSYY
jgi:hypothetical protein